jgi:hypothetical protein
MRIALFLLGLLVAGGALAEPDTFGLGTGRSGSRLIDAPDTVINQYGLLTANVATGSRDLTLANSSVFTVGGLVLIHQSAGLSPAPASGSQQTVNLGLGAVGRFEYARVESVSATGLRLTAPLLYAYTANVTQVVSVPEYTDLEVRPGATLRAAPWDGSRGGILAALVSGTLRNDGLISVAGAGFRGGTYVNHPNILGCTAMDVPVADGGSYKGEGVVAGRFGAASGRGNLANGGGGGNCHNAGGGGGSHSGAGGKGGRSSDGDRDVGGLGGAPVAYVPFQRIAFGGGGGAGEGDDDVGTSGGAGGGLMLLRAAAVVGTGRFSAAGASAGDTVLGGDDGAGGGGAGGAISLRAFQGLGCGLAEARGGSGGNTTHPSFLVGPGGGGGGGVVFLQGETITCPTQVLAGTPGSSAATGDSRGAGPATTDGGTAYGFEQTVLLPFQLPSTPVVTLPAEGAVDVPRRPRFEGTAEPGVIVHLFLDGTPYVQLGSGGDGAFVYNASADLAPGPHQLTASIEVLGIRSLVSAPRSFSVVAPPDAGIPDGGSDGGSTDPEPPPDAGLPDAGVPDGGEQPDGPVRPVIVVPAEGEQVDPTPLFAGTSSSGESVSIEVDDVEVARVPRDKQGRFRYALTLAQALEPGSHRVTAHARDEAGNPGTASLTTTFEVLPPSDLTVGCGCGSSPGMGLAGLVLGLGAWAARRRRRG